MAIGRYKVVKVIEQDGKAFGLGEQLILDDKQAKELLDTGKVQLATYLDPEDPNDAAIIAHFKDNPKGHRRESHNPEVEANRAAE